MASSRNDTRILMIFTSHATLGSSGKAGGYFLPEAAHPYHEFFAAGCTIDFASPEGGEVPLDPTSKAELAKDPVSRAFLDSQDVAAKLRSTAQIAHIDFDQYACVFFVGGHAPMWDLPGLHVLANKLAAYYEGGGIIAAVCHGPCALLNVAVGGRMLLEGKTVTCFSNQEEVIMKMDKIVPFLLQDKLCERGAIFTSAAEPFGVNVVVSERIYTGQNLRLQSRWRSACCATCGRPRALVPVQASAAA